MEYTSWESLVKPGDLVFDVGAHIGSKTELFLAKGARVIAIEPQPRCVETLRSRFSSPSVEILAVGMSDHTGSAELSICAAAPTISTFADHWKTGRFSSYVWNSKTTIPVRTLDAVIAEWGVPRYCKIDVEGYEFQVLKGLSRGSVELISFEFAIEFVDNARLCLDHLNSLGYQQFNLATGENSRFHFPLWVSASEIIEFIRTSSDPALWGDIYAFTAPR